METNAIRIQVKDGVEKKQFVYTNVLQRRDEKLWIHMYHLQLET